MRKILLADDDQNLAHLTKIALVNKGYDVFIVQDSLQVMEAIKKYKPDLILMDIMMPQLSGAELVKMIKHDANLNKIPVIFLTGLISGDEDIEAEGINIEGSNYQSLGKPYEMNHLLKVVENTLSQVRR